MFMVREVIVEVYKPSGHSIANTILHNELKS